MGLREAAQQALDALEDSHQNINPERRYADELTRQIADSITALRAALAENQSEDVLGMVEPVAYCTLEQLAHLKLTVPSDDKIALYTAPPKREPLTEAELEPIRRRMMMEAYNEADDGDSERYNALKAMANDVLDMLLGGEK